MNIQQSKINPPLRRLSDYLYVCWKQIAGNNNAAFRGLRWIIHTGVTNDDTERIVKAATGKSPGSGYVWPPYPGFTFRMNNAKEKPFATALVGTPNGEDDKKP